MVVIRVGAVPSNELYDGACRFGFVPIRLGEAAPPTGCLDTIIYIEMKGPRQSALR